MDVPGKLTITNKTLYVPELISAYRQPFIDHTEFVNCRLIGPSVIRLTGAATMVGCWFDVTSPESMFWELPDPAPRRIGAIIFESCTFQSCIFRNIGFAVTPNERQSFMENTLPASEVREPAHE